MHHTFTVTTMTCGHCEQAVTRAVQRLDSQATVRIDRAANRVEVNSGQTRDALAAAIVDAGYTVAP